MALKGNQGGLFEEVQWLFDQAQAVQFHNVAHDFFHSMDQGHGRMEIRRCGTLSELDYLVQKPLSKGLQTVVMVQSQRRLNGQTSSETGYYISALTPQAAKVAKAVRAHWSLENCLHWVLDVSFDQDACRIRKDDAAQTMALLGQIALNLLGQDKSTNAGIAATRKKAGWDDAYLLKILQ